MYDKMLPCSADFAWQQGMVQRCVQAMCTAKKACLIRLPASGIKFVLGMGEQVLKVVSIDAPNLHPEVDCPGPHSSVRNAIQHDCAVILLHRSCLISGMTCAMSLRISIKTLSRGILILSQ